MPVLPLPMVIALVLGFLLVKSWLDGRSNSWLLALIGLCALQNLILAGGRHYGLVLLHPVQAVVATVIPPLAWMACLVTTARGPQRRDLVHVLGPLTVFLLVCLRLPQLDMVIMAVFLGYGVAILLHLRRGRDGLSRLGLASDNTPLVLWLVMALVLLAGGLSDLLIWIDFAFGEGANALFIISIFSSMNLALIGLVSLAPSLSEASPDEGSRAAASPDPEDEVVFSKLEAQISEQKLYLDPDLTLARLSRKLRLPEKRISAAVNRQTGENVSRYINSFRVQSACDLLNAGETVTQAMYTSGFNTKSNFNREFRRITGQSPSAWREANKAS